MHASTVHAIELELDHVEIRAVGPRWQIRVCYWDLERGQHIFNGHDTPLYADKYAAQCAAEELASYRDAFGKMQMARIIWH
jgi:hypothetical protein